MSKGLIVVKYGGSVLDSGSAIRKAAESIKKEIDKGRKIVIVVSAMKGVTDKLMDAAETVSLNPPSDMIDHIIGLGEEQTVRLMTTALKSMGVDAVEITPNSPSWPILTDESFGNANPILEECQSGIELGLIPLLKRGRVPVICGFVGRSLSGKITTLGRGGSDTTATLLANCLHAEELILIKDTDGVYTADPHKIDHATPIKSLEAWEAYLLSSSGAKVLHQKVFKYIPPHLKVRIVSNTAGLESGGTLIQGINTSKRIQIHGNPVLKMLILGDVISNPKLLSNIFERISNEEGEILALTGNHHATTLLIDGNPKKVFEGVHNLILTEDSLKAVSGSENLAFIDINYFGEENQMIKEVNNELSSNGIVIRGFSTTHSSITILVDWNERGKAFTILKSIEERKNE